MVMEHFLQSYTAAVPHPAATASGGYVGDMHCRDN